MPPPTPLPKVFQGLFFITVGRPGSQSELRYSVESLDTYRSPAAVNSSASQNSNVIHSTKVSSTHEDSHQTVEVPFKWPGIEAVLESYQKHCEGNKRPQSFESSCEQ